MNTSDVRPNWRILLAQYAWMAAFLCVRAHYFLTVIVARVFGWR